MKFKSEKELVKFANHLLRSKCAGLRKEMRICLRADPNGSHAYFPALITIIGFFDFMSGVHAGRLDGPGLKELQRYIGQFVRNKADYEYVDILYNMFRHKIAHIAQPYLVFDTHSKLSLRSSRRRRITWTVGIYRQGKPIELTDHKPKLLIKTPTPWSTKYDARIKISLTAMRKDATESVVGKSGLLRYIKTNKEAQDRFEKCMREYALPDDGT